MQIGDANLGSRPATAVSLEGEGAQTPALTVITPAYNSARTLQDTIDSAIALGPNVQIIVVDDGSTDNTAEILARYGDSIQTIRQTNQGMSASRNNALKHATGEFVLFLDADDMALPNLLSDFTEHKNSHPEADVFYGDFRCCDDNGSDQGLAKMAPMTQEAAQELIRCNQMGILATIVRTSKVREVGGFDEALLSSADWDLWIRLARSGAKFSYVPKPISMYRLTTGSASKQFWRMHRALRQIQSKHSDFLKATGEERKIKRAHLATLVERTLPYFYGADTQQPWIARRWNRLRKAVELCTKDPNMFPIFIARTAKALAQKVGIRAASSSLSFLGALCLFGA